MCMLKGLILHRAYWWAISRRVQHRMKAGCYSTRLGTGIPCPESSCLVLLCTYASLSPRPSDVRGRLTEFASVSRSAEDRGMAPGAAWYTSGASSVSWPCDWLGDGSGQGGWYDARVKLSAPCAAYSRSSSTAQRWASEKCLRARCPWGECRPQKVSVSASASRRICKNVGACW